MSIESQEQQAPPKRRRGVLVAAGLVVVAAVVVAGIAAVRANADDSSDLVAVTVPVAISAKKAPTGLTIGIILTLGTDAEGAEWNEAAQGARVAQQRLKLGGTAVALDAEDDHGSEAGAREAVRRLVGKGVSGIVIASSGVHVAAAVTAAAEAGIPAILPYAPLPASRSQAGDSWTLAPTPAQEKTALRQALGSATRPLLVDAGAGMPEGWGTIDRVAVPKNADLLKTASEVAGRTDADTASNGAYFGSQPIGPVTPSPSVSNDAIVISGAAVSQAAIVRALQAKNISVPIVLTGSATSPAFAAALASDGGSVGTNLSTIGSTWGDSTALDTNAGGRAMSAFLAANRLFAEDSAIRNLTDDAPFASVAGAADSRSHDAVLALVRAAETAGSTTHADVATALERSTFGPQDAMAGPKLDFTRPAALAGSVVPLSATGQDLMLRPTGNAADAVVWFPEPAAG